MKLSIPFMLLLAVCITTPAYAYQQPSHTSSSAKLVNPPKRSLLNRIFRSKWAGVDPLLREKLEPVYKQLKEEGYDIRLVEGLRSQKRQAELLASGTGVTGVGAGRSCHNWGLAVDSAVFINGKPSWDLKNPLVVKGYKRYGELAKLAGLNWGGDWVDPVDLPHVELKSDCRIAVRHQKRVERTEQYAYEYEPHPDVHTYAVHMDEPVITISMLPEDIQPAIEACFMIGGCPNNVSLAIEMPWNWTSKFKMTPVVFEPAQEPACAPHPWHLNTWELMG